MRMSQGIKVLAMACVMVAGTALAKDKWDKVADLSAGGDAKEVTINREVSAIRLVASTETVTVNTIVVREGAKKTPYTVAARLILNEKREIALPSKAMVTGLRISDAGRGAYAVYVK